MEIPIDIEAPMSQTASRQRELISEGCMHALITACVKSVSGNPYPTIIEQTDVVAEKGSPLKRAGMSQLLLGSTTTSTEEIPGNIPIIVDSSANEQESTP